jgi:hypothetical protein
MMGGCCGKEAAAESLKKVRLCQRERDKVHCAATVLEQHSINLESDLYETMMMVACCHNHQASNDIVFGGRPENDDSRTMDFSEYESYSEEVDAILR